MAEPKGKFARLISGLEPCPECDGTVELIDVHVLEDTGFIASTFQAMYCPKCGTAYAQAEPKVHATDQSCARWWNDNAPLWWAENHTNDGGKDD